MRCVVTAGPTFEPLDEVRRLTNFSSGRLGTLLACHLAGEGHAVTLLRGAQSVWPATDALAAGVQVTDFGSTNDLRTHLEREAETRTDAVFHAAAVSDFHFGRVWRRGADHGLVEVRAGKLDTRQGALLAELLPTPKLLAALRDWFPGAWLVGWKYEVEGDRRGAIARAQSQIRDCRTNACVVNGPAYGVGFGVLGAAGPCEHAETIEALFHRLSSALNVPAPRGGVRDSPGSP